MSLTDYPLLLDDAITVLPPSSLHECACVHPDRWMCAAHRLDVSYEQIVEHGDECQCFCHDDEEEEEDESN